jgi:hypothetical protein
MKPRHLLAILAVGLTLPGLLPAQTLTSGVPGFISYQGRVLDSSGAPVGTTTPVNRKVIFRVWDHPSNVLAANLIYSEEQTVTIADGKFSVLVGQGVGTTGGQLTFTETNYGPDGTPSVSIANAFNGSGRFLGVTVDDGTAAVDNEIAPRQQIVSSAFAFRAKFAETLGTSAGTALTVLDSGNVGVGNASPPALFTITGANTSTSTPQLVVTADDVSERLRIGVDSTGNGTGFLQAYKEGVGATNLLLNPNGGNVGIGTASSTEDAKLFIRNDGAGDAAILYSPAKGPHRIHLQNGPLGNVYLRSASSAGGVFLQDSGGNVGIGTSGPAAKLEISNNAYGNPLQPLLKLTQNTTTWVSGPVFDAFRFISTGGGDTGSTGKQFHVGAGGVSIGYPNVPTYGGWDALYVSGNVGIGTTSPNQAKLVVNGTNGSDSIGGHYSYGSGGVVSANSFSGNVSGVSIKASDAIHASIFRAVSDARIKVIEGVSDGAVDLGTLSRIEITNYTYKDVIGKGKNRSKKVIAQQVETVFPQAVSKSVDVVPDIYKRAVIAEGWVELATDLKKGERVRLISDKHDGVHEVLEVEADRFRTAYRPDLKNDSAAPVVATAVDPSVGVQKAADKATAAADVADEKGNPAAGEGHVFVFGREVNDFRAVDYDAISMLNVSATQELAKQVEAVTKENAALKAKLAASEQLLSELKAGNTARDARLTALEKQFPADKSAVVPVSLKTAAE